MVSKVQNLNIRWLSQAQLRSPFSQIRLTSTQSTPTTSPESIQFLTNSTTLSSPLPPLPSSPSYSSSSSIITTTTTSSSPIKSVGQYRAYSPQHFYNNRILDQYAYQSVNTVTLRQLLS